MANKIVFGALLGLIVIAAIPYGTVEPWWKAAFVCAVFVICIVALIEMLVSGSFEIPGRSILLPMLALAVLACVQTLSLGSLEVAGFSVWNTISADPYQTRFFALQMLALTACLALFYRYAPGERRIPALVYTILAVAVASAIFGILRQTTQDQIGFVLPLLKPAQGYGQFINKNHFAYLMEMAFGLGLGLALARGVRRERLLIYFALLLPIWTALVLSNSRGGVLAMMVQIVVAALFLMSRQPVMLKAALIIVLVLGILFGTFWVGGDRLASNFQAATTELSTTRAGATRNEIWRATSKMFAAHPILGVGMGGYCEPCEAIVDGQKREVPALEEREEFSLDGVLYEAFNTSGGLGTLCETLAGKVRTLNYRTIRYPGHAAIMKALLHDLRLKDRRDVLKDILEQAVPTTMQDVVIVFVTVAGMRDGHLQQDTYARKIYSHVLAGKMRSAIQITTAGSLCAMLDMLADGRLPQSGFVRQEDVPLADFLANRFGRFYAMEELSKAA